MRISLFIGIVIATFGFVGPAMSDEPQVVEAKPGNPELAWIGLDLGKLEGAMRAHAGSIPMGVGFVVESVVPGGPAEGSGIKSYDILWKMEDQLLINEAQLATLLRLRKPDDQVELHLMRSGQELSVTVTLGTLPLHQVKRPVPASEIPLYPTGIPGMPTQIVYPGNRTAETSREDGSTARLYYEDDVAHVILKDSDDVLIYQGPLRKDGELQVPEEWRRSVGALMRTMWKAQDDGWRPRRPRPRVVNPPRPKVGG